MQRVRQSGASLRHILLLAALVCVGITNVAANSLLAKGRALEEHADYTGAINVYRQYLGAPSAHGAAKRNIKLRLPVLQEAIGKDAVAELPLFLAALDARADSDITRAGELLHQIETEYPDSHLRDDAAYLRAYMALMNRFDFADAAARMRQLRTDYPQTAYFDTAIYSEAIAEEQAGNAEKAEQLLAQLKERHTGVTVDWFDLSWPQDSYNSRYWHQRSTERLLVIAAAHATGARILSRRTVRNGSYTTRMVLAANGHEFPLLLARSPTFNATSLGSQEKQLLMSQPNESLAGIVEGAENSWARINIDGDNITGMLSLNGERIELQSQSTTGSLSDYNRLLLSDADGNPSSIEDDTLTAPSDMNDLDQYLRSIRADSSVRAHDDNGVTQVARLGVVIDSQYNAYHGGNGLQKALSILNTTDGIFRDEFGLAMHVDKAIVITDRNNDPMRLGSVTIESMMRNFREYRTSSSLLGSDIGLATLFSGNKNNDAPVGLAWIGTACRTDGFDVSVVTPFAQGALLSVHEIGHTLGAQHDSDTACGESNYLMSRHLSNGTNNTFSSCSRDSIRQRLALASCHSDALDLRLEVGAIQRQAVEFYVHNNSPYLAAPAAVLRISMSNGEGFDEGLLPANCSLVGVNELECQVGELQPFDYQYTEILFAQPVGDAVTLTAAAEPVGFMDVETFNNTIYADFLGNSYQTPDFSNDLGPVVIAAADPADDQLPVQVGGGAGAFSSFGLVLGGLLLGFFKQRLINLQAH